MEPVIEIVEARLHAPTVADEIVASISDTLAEKDRCSLVLSGGSTPAAIYRNLSRPPRVAEIEWDKIALYWGDERWVAKDNNLSNYHMVDETLLHNLSDPLPQCFSVDTSLESAEAGALDYERVISAEEGVAAGEYPKFDIVLLGVGEDGHFASVFPHSSHLAADPFAQPAPICFAAENPDDGTRRVSLSPAAILSAQRIFVLVKGSGKSEIVRKVLEGGEFTPDIPASILHFARGRLRWFIDSEAAQKLAQFRG